MEMHACNKHHQRLTEAIAKLQLPPLEVRVLEEIAKDPYGITPLAAPSMLAPLTHQPLEECQEAVLQLVSKKLLLRVEVGNEARLVADYDLLGLPEETRQALRLLASPFETLDSPHSPKAMSSLNQWFLDEHQPIYLGLEITSHKVFTTLGQRANNGYMTIFLMPRRSHVPAAQQTHYDEILKAWKRFLRDESKRVRRNVRIYLTNRPYRSLYTSALGPKSVRFDLYYLNQDTTRKGTMVQAPLKTSLYKLVYDEYENAYSEAEPLASIWFWDWLKAQYARYRLLIWGAVFLIMSALLSWAGDSWVPFLGLALAGAGVSLVTNHLAQKKWTRRTLYKNR